MGNHPDIKSLSHVTSLQPQEVSHVGCLSYGRHLEIDSQLQVPFAVAPGGASHCIAECVPQGTGNHGAQLELCLPQSLSGKGQITRKYEQRIPGFFFFIFCCCCCLCCCFNSNKQKPKQKILCPCSRARHVESRLRTALVSPRLRGSVNGSAPTRDGGGDGHLEPLGRCQARGEHPVSVTLCHEVWKPVKPKRS